MFKRIAYYNIYANFKTDIPIVIDALPRRRVSIRKWVGASQKLLIGRIQTRGIFFTRDELNDLVSKYPKKKCIEMVRKRWKSFRNLW